MFYGLSPVRHDRTLRVVVEVRLGEHRVVVCGVGVDVLVRALLRFVGELGVVVRGDGCK